MNTDVMSGKAGDEIISKVLDSNTTLNDKIISTLKEYKDPISPKELAELLGKNKNNIMSAVNYIINSGKPVIRLGNILNRRYQWNTNPPKEAVVKPVVVHEGGKLSQSQIIEKALKDHNGPITPIKLSTMTKLKHGSCMAAVSKMISRGCPIIRGGKSALDRTYEWNENYIHVDNEDVDKLTDELMTLSEPEKKVKKPKAKSKKTLTSKVDIYLERAYYLVKAKESCSSHSFEDFFNISREDAIILSNRVVKKYPELDLECYLSVKSKKK